MNTKRVMDFFKNKVTIKLKTGHQFRGLLAEIDYKSNIIVLCDIEDLGNQNNEDKIPLDKKISDKAFEAENIEEILFADKLFAEPKKYNRNDFFDSMTEAKDQKGGYKGRQRDERGDNRTKKRRENHKNYQNHHNDYKKPNHERQHEKQKKKYEQKYQKKQDDRDFR